MNVFAIAEIGINHHGNIWKAFDMILAARDAGATAAKFQYYLPLEVLGPDSPHLEYATQCHLTKADHERLRRYCEYAGIEYMVSTFDLKDLQWSDNLCNSHKIASRMNSDGRFIDRAASFGKPVAMSIQDKKQEVLYPQFSYMWCVSKYPSDKDEVLSFIFDSTHGISSHCPDPSATIDAVKRGARLIENHVCEDKNERGCDIGASLDFRTYNQMLREIRSIG